MAKACGAVVLGLVLITACGLGNSARRKEAAAPAQATGQQVKTQSLPAVEQKVIYTADVAVRVGSIETAGAKAIEIVNAASGFVFSQTSELEGEREATLTLKVPPARFDQTLDDLAHLGTAIRRESKAQDVTADVVDLEGRLKTAQASADRLRSLLADARTTADVASVEGELARRESEIESVQGRLRVLTSQVDLATINLRLTEKKDLPKLDDDLPGFVGSMKTGAVVLADIGVVALAVIGFLIPFVPVALVVWLMVWWLLRRHRRRKPPVVSPG